jgi:hypothetical protein
MKGTRDLGPAGWLEREPFRVLDGADDEEDATAWGPIPLREAGKSIDHSRAYVVLWCQYRKGTQQKHWFSAHWCLSHPQPLLYRLARAVSCSPRSISGEASRITEEQQPVLCEPLGF